MCRPGPSGPARLALALLACVVSERGANADIRGFLLISSPRHARISWVRLPDGPAGSTKLAPQTLLQGQALLHPQGIAVDEKHKRLIVADPDNMTIWSYQLAVEGGSLRAVLPPDVVVHGLESRWVAVDSNSNLLFSDEPENQIWKMPMATAQQPRPGEGLRALYYGDSTRSVSSPGGVAVDNLHVYWTNKRWGWWRGSVVRASEKPLPEPREAESVVVLGKTSRKCYGLCLALSNVYYTDSSRKLFGVKKTGGKAAVVSSALSKPRGCAWDGDGAVYVADRGNGAVYFFPGNMVTIDRVDVVKAFDLEDAFGLAFLAHSAVAAGSDEAEESASTLGLGLW